MGALGHSICITREHLGLDFAIRSYKVTGKGNWVIIF